jgi:putrescine aminotransferase
VERAILHEGPSTVAAFIGEPISAAAGIHVPHPEYWPTIHDPTHFVSPEIRLR